MTDTKSLVAGLLMGSMLLTAQAQAAEVNVYSARHYDSDVELFQRFTEETGIEVRVLEGDSDQLVERIRREGIASPADVLITVDAGRLWRADEAGILGAVDSEILNTRIPANLRHPDGHWFGFSQRLRVIFYSKERFDPSRIERYEDLASPGFEGQLCIRSSNNIYNQSLLAGLIETVGEDAAREWAEGVVANLARPPQGGDTDQIRGVAAGECDIAVGNHYYHVRLEQSTDPADQAVADAVGIIFPNQGDRGVHVNIGGAALVETAPNRENAIRLLEYLASDTAQNIFSGGNFEYPAVASVPGSAAVGQLDNLVLDQTNVAVLGTNNPRAVRLFDQAGWR